MPSWKSVEMSICIRNSLCGNCASEVAGELIESGLKLKIILKAGQFTYLEPLNVYVDKDTSFDMWMDADSDIQTSELYCRAELLEKSLKSYVWFSLFGRSQAGILGK